MDAKATEKKHLLEQSSIPWYRTIKSLFTMDH